VWGEFLRNPRDVEYFTFPRAIALAEVVWSPASDRNYKEFLDRLKAHLRRLDALNVHYRRLDAREL
jgi:hexosaminidase